MTNNSFGNPMLDPTGEQLLEDVEAAVLVVWNDDVNTFDWVIESLIEICEHTPEQAEQSALLIHFKGKCDVKKGELKDLVPMERQLLDRGISAQVMY